MFSYGPPHMAEQKQDDQLEPTYSSSVRIRDVATWTYQRRWTIRRSGEKGSGISVLTARYDDYYYLHWNFSHQCQLMVFHWSLSDSKSTQVSRILLSILAVLNNVVARMVSTRLPTSKFSSPFSNPLVSVPKVPITIDIIVTLMFHSFFNSLARSRYLPYFLYSFSFILWSAGTAKSTILQVLFFFLLLIIIMPGLLVEIRWSIGTSKSHRSWCVSLSRTGAGLCIYHLLVWSNWNFLHISHWITLPTQSFLALYSCAYLLHLLIMWLIISSLLPHSLHLLLCCVIAILILIWLVLMALSCAAIRRDSVIIITI